MTSGKRQTCLSHESLYSNQILLCDNKWIVFTFATLNDWNALPTYMKGIIWTLGRKRVSTQPQSCWSWCKQSCLHAASVPVLHATFVGLKLSKWLLKMGPQGSAIMLRTPCMWQGWLWCANKTNGEGVWGQVVENVLCKVDKMLNIPHELQVTMYLLASKKRTLTERKMWMNLTLNWEPKSRRCNRCRCPDKGALGNAVKPT